jgi:hypothetical protein
VSMSEPRCGPARKKGFNGAGHDRPLLAVEPRGASDDWASDGRQSIRVIGWQYGTPVRRRSTTPRVAFLLLGCGLLLAVPAYAYIDPNAQSLLTQILTPILVLSAAGLTFLRKQAGSAIGWLAGRVRRQKK